MGFGPPLLFSVSLRDSRQTALPIGSADHLHLRRGNNGFKTGCH